MKLFVLVLSSLIGATAFAGSSREAFVEMADYSRPLVKSLAISYLSGYLRVKSEDLKQEVDEIIVNDQNGTKSYDVEVLFNDGSAKVIEFNNLDPVRLQ